MSNPSLNERRKEIATPCRALRFFYHTWPGRCLLKIVASPGIAKLTGAFLDTGLSRPLIKKFIKKNNIDVSRYEERRYSSYNDYFTRRLKDGIFTVNETPGDLIAPCDSRVSIYPIDADSIFTIKNSLYRVSDLLGDEALAKRFEGGWCMIFRLCVDDYHRYYYVDSGSTGAARHIRGVLHTVQPIATERYNIYARNTREITLQDSDHFGTIAYVEVGAMMIGRICNHKKEKYTAAKGEEKGYFEYGGSTVVILIEKDRVEPDSELLTNTADGYETVVRLGETVGTASQKV